MARRRLVALVVGLALVTTLGWGRVPERARAGQAAGVTILFDTHLHGNLTGSGDVTMAHYAGLIAQRRAANPGALFLGAGDDLGSSAMSSIFKGRQMVDAFNAMGLDANTLGNHEFDYGPDNFLEQARAARFAWVTANVTDRRTGGPFGEEVGVRRFVIKEVNGVRVGITGVAWLFTSATNAGPNLVVDDPVTALRSLTPRMRAEGAQLVVVMSHLCGVQAEAVAAQVDGIDAIIGDHCAERLKEAKLINNTIVARRGDEFDALGELTLRVESGRRVSFSYTDHEVTKDTPEDPALTVLVADYRRRLDAELEVVIGETTEPLDNRRPVVRGAESNTGNLIADTLHAWGKADVALQNGGGVRGERIVPAGPVTRATILEILPFNNTAALLRVTGVQLRAALENGVSGQVGTAGKFPQVSGLTFVYNPDAPSGSRVLSVAVGGRPLDPAATYTLATNDFVAGGGDDYTMLRDAEVLIPAAAGPLVSVLVIEAVEAAGTIAPKVEGRINTGR